MSKCARSPMYTGADPGIEGGGAEVKYLQRENFTLRHSHFGVIWARGPNEERGPGEAFKSIRVALKGSRSWKGMCFLRVERGRKRAIECYTNCIRNGAL